MIAEYPSLQAFEVERAARREDVEYLRLSRETEDLMMPGTFGDEHLEEPVQPG